MKKHMSPSDACYAIIKKYEGLRLSAYLCPAGVWTIGYGHTGPDVVRGLRITAERADELLRADVKAFADAVNKAVSREITQAMFDAFVSICFNTGPGKKGQKDGVITLKSGQPSTLLRKLNAGDFAGAANEFLKWTKAGGAVLKGLETRRKAERELFLS